MTNLPSVLLADSDHTRYVQSDYERSRATLLALLEDAKEAVQLAMEVARSTEHPAAVAALATLLKNVADINDKLMGLNQRYKDYYSRDDRHRVDEPVPGGSTTVTNNYLFSGTVSDLQKKLSGMNDEKLIDITPNDSTNIRR